jgi:hypothetical protein
VFFIVSSLNFESRDYCQRLIVYGVMLAALVPKAQGALFAGVINKI